MPEYIFVLGAPNNEMGELSDIALSRAKAAAFQWRELTESAKTVKVVPTGGFGTHFNNTDKPHWLYLDSELRRLGVPKEAIETPGLESGNTVEDAALVIDYLTDRAVDSICVVTSNVHIERCRFVFCSLAPRLQIDFVGSELPDDERSIAHEARSIARLKSQGGVFVANRFFAHPEHSV